jgi:hypothetical protein
VTTIDEILQRIINTRHKHQELLAAAFLAEVGVPPSQCTLVEERSDDGKTVRWWFERRGEVIELEPKETEGGTVFVMPESKDQPA